MTSKAPATSGEALAGQATPAPAEPRPLASLALVLFVFTIVVSQPILDIIGRNPEFLVAHDVSPADVVGFAVTVGVIIPAIIGGAIALLRRIAPPAGLFLHVVVLSSLAGLLLSRVLAPFLGRFPLVLLAVSGLLGLAVGCVLTLVAPVRRLAMWGAVLSIVTVGLFLFASPAAGLLDRGQGDEANALTSQGDRPPIVMIVLDEFALTSVLDRAGDLDADAYPGLARLARDATFYRNAVAVHPNTERVVPALLTGQFPERRGLPVAADHPENLFTILGAAYDVHAEEPVTRLCPDDICSDRQTASASSRLADMARDLSIVSMHVLLPEHYKGTLPPIDEGWRDFGAGVARHDMNAEFGQASRRHRGQDFMRAIRKIAPSHGEPRLDFVHSLLPHMPWEFLPTGQTYGMTRVVPGLTQEKGWSDNQWLVEQAYQRYLLQTQYVDTLVAQVIEELEREGVYDETLLVITADHGVSFVPGSHRRRFEPGSIGGTAWFPLFIKAPGQDAGQVDDRPVMTVDVLPTVLDLIGAAPSEFSLDGRSLAGEIPADRDRSVPGGEEWPTFDVAQRDASLAKKFELFPPVEGWPLGLTLVPDRSALQLLGTRVEGDIPEESGVAAVVDRPWPELEVKPSQDVIAAEVRGHLTGQPAATPAVLAVARNGVVEAVTETWDNGEAGGEATFSALLRYDRLRPGRHSLQLLRVDSSGRLASVIPID